jgi:hypothetical protein
MLVDLQGQLNAAEQALATSQEALRRVSEVARRFVTRVYPPNPKSISDDVAMEFADQFLAALTSTKETE